MDLRRAALSGVRWTLAGRAVLQLVTWPITILVMRLLDPGHYGLFAIAMIVTGFIAMFAELGLGVALLQAREVTDELARTAASLIIGLNLAVVALLFALAPALAHLYDEPELTLLLRLVSVDLLFTALAAVPQMMLQRSLRFREMSLAQLAGGATGAFATLCCAWAGFGVWSLVAGLLVTGVVRSTAILMFHGGVVWPRRIGMAALRPIAGVSGHVVAGRVLFSWYSQADQLLLGQLLNATALGLYNVAEQLSMLPAGKVMEALNRVAYPILSQARNDAVAARQSHVRLVSFVALFAFGVCWGMAGVSRDFIALVLGPKWEGAALVLALLALVAPLRMLCALHNTLVTALAVPQAATRELLLAGVLIPGSVAIGALAAGLQGAATSWLITFPVVYGVSNLLTCRAVGVPMRVGCLPLAAPVAAGVLMLVAVWAVREALGSDSGLALRLAAQIIAGGAVYAGAMCLLAPSLVSEARGLTRELLRPGRAAA